MRWASVAGCFGGVVDAGEVLRAAGVDSWLTGWVADSSEGEAGREVSVADGEASDGG